MKTEVECNKNMINRHFIILTILCGIYHLKLNPATILGCKNINIILFYKTTLFYRIFFCEFCAIDAQENNKQTKTVALGDGDRW
jgi:hypothetical protein